MFLSTHPTIDKKISSTKSTFHQINKKDLEDLQTKSSITSIIPSITLLGFVILFLSASFFSAISLYADTPPDGWKIEIHAMRTNYIDQSKLILGASSVCANGYDIFDDEHPPLFPDRYLDIFTKHIKTEAG